MTPNPQPSNMPRNGNNGLGVEALPNGRASDQSAPQRDIFDEIMPPLKLVMCEPRYLSTRVSNNKWMKHEEIDVPRALRQFSRAQNIFNALDVETALIPPVPECQDQTYVANIGIAIKPYIILANYKAEGRACEVEPARQFFESLGYQCVHPPFHFEGEADLKKVSEGVYIGGYGQFTDIQTYQWIEELTGVQIVPVHEISEQLYHLDCSLLIVDEQHALITEAGLDPNSIKAIEQILNVTMTPRGKGLVHTGITNAVLVPDKRIVCSGTFNPELPEYRKAMEWLNKTFDGFGYTCVFLDVDEFDKSGADLSCCTMHLDFDPEEAGSNGGTMRSPDQTNVATGPEPVAPRA